MTIKFTKYQPSSSRTAYGEPIYESIEYDSMGELMASGVLYRYERLPMFTAFGIERDQIYTYLTATFSDGTQRRLGYLDGDIPTESPAPPTDQ